uniref:DUF1906 domain-containing protein n=1 Tax=Actinomadura roseirufa TaxID=2094049 RepID=UPI00104125BE
PPAGAGRTVRYRGLRIPVPAGWAVRDLDADPSRCVRYDRHAIYLGRPGPQPDCPARVVGRTEVLHIAPLDGAAAPAAPAPRPRITPETGGRTGAPAAARVHRPASFTVPRNVAQETRLALPEAGVVITGVYGTDPAALQRVLRGIEPISVRPGAPRPAGVAPTPPDDPSDMLDMGDIPPDLLPGEPPPGPAEPDGEQPGEPAVEAHHAWASGRGFDTCTAPSLATMRAWRPSFKVTNIYIGGAARGCAQPNLTASWIRQVRRMGYRITPTYVGMQAPCGHRPQRFTAGNAASQGARNAADAALRARALGIPHHRPIYFDMEAYRGGHASCKAAVLRFVDAWVRGLRARDYVPCLYSSAKSGIRDVGRATGISKPGCIWFANWDGMARLYGDPFVKDEWWSPHRRVKQYRGGHRERHGGVTLNIDSDIADGRVY